MYELCAECGRAYEDGKHEVGADGRFPLGGHYFVGEEDDEEEEYDIQR